MFISIWIKNNTSTFIFKIFSYNLDKSLIPLINGSVTGFE